MRDRRSEKGVGCPNFAFKKVSFEAKLSKTETVLLRFASVLRNHKKKCCFISLCKFRFVSLKKRVASAVSLKKVTLQKFCLTLTHTAT